MSQNKCTGTTKKGRPCQRTDTIIHNGEWRCDAHRPKQNQSQQPTCTLEDASRYLHHQVEMMLMQFEKRAAYGPFNGLELRNEMSFLRKYATLVRRARGERV